MWKERRLHPGIWLGIVVVAVAAIAVLVILPGVAGVRIVDSAPADGEGGVPITAPIRFGFSQPMDPDSVGANFGIEPEVGGRLELNGKEAIFWPHSGLAPDTVYRVTVEAGATSEGGRPVGEAYTWQFRTRAPQLLYLGWPEPGAEVRQLFAADLDGSPPRQLTDRAGGVWDYAVHPQGEEIVYSVLREDGGSDLWRMDRDGAGQNLLLACPEAACLNPAWSADGRQLAYERRDIWADAPNLDRKAGRIWLWDVDKEEDRPLFDYDVPLHSPVWAPQGERLAMVSPMLPGIEVYDLPSEDLEQFGNEWGAAPVWSPDATQLAVPELMLAGESLVVRLVIVDLDNGEMLDISGDDDFVKDVSPAWSPGGGWIAIGRQFLDEERWTPGRQIWLVRPDGSEAYALLEEPMVDHFAFAWRPDGAALAYVGSDLSEGPQPVPDVSIWILDLIQREPWFVAGDGVLPGWLP
jgi:Tol biopolymer transport system component